MSSAAQEGKRENISSSEDEVSSEEEEDLILEAVYSTWEKWLILDVFLLISFLELLSLIFYKLNIGFTHPANKVKVRIVYLATRNGMM